MTGPTNQTKSVNAPQSDETDRIFSRENAPDAFVFDDGVARVFPDMLRRSIPGYETLLSLIGLLADQVVADGSRVYDLGCSLGAVSFCVRDALRGRDATIIAVDNSPAMIDRLNSQLENAEPGSPIEAICTDVGALELENASLVVLNFTLQFLELAQRDELVQRIASALQPGGVLILSEKTEASTPRVGRMHTRLHDAFREAQGYSRLELARKRQALENVLVAESEEVHVARLERAGLHPAPWFRCLQFASWLAEKPR